MGDQGGKKDKDKRNKQETSQQKQNLNAKQEKHRPKT